MIEHQHAHWSRLSASPHAVRREAERRCQGMPMADEREGLTLEQKLKSIGACAFFAIPFAGYCFGTTGAVVTALLLIAGAVTEWVLARRPL